MPLHLLGKKSWNVYNHDNVERVKRDEADAAAKEAAEEQRMQEIDSERRIRRLRGETVEAIEETVQADAEPYRSTRPHDDRSRKRRKLPGEDDTDREIRHAREAQLSGHEERPSPSTKHKSDIPIYDSNGHINLFPEDNKMKGHAKTAGNPEAEAEKARKDRQLEDQYTMRFANASGFKQTVGAKPWYHDGKRESISKNVWGEDDPLRQQRQQTRMAIDDPLATIQRGVKGLRQAEKDRQQWKERQRRDIKEMVRQEQRDARRARRHRNASEDLEGFSLDATPKDGRERSHRRHHHSDRHRTRSPPRHRRREKIRSDE